jgi:hypothetical protein
MSVFYKLCKFNVATEELVEEITFDTRVAAWFLSSKLGDLPVFMGIYDTVDLVYSTDGEYVFELHQCSETPEVSE